MGDDHHEEDRPDYDPATPNPPEREPPLRSTAPQSDFSMAQVGFGVGILLVGLVLTFGLGILLA